MRETTFVKDGETNVITKRGLLYIEGYHLVETKNGTVRAYEQIPRNVIGKYFDWLEEVECNHTGPFWGTTTVACLAFLAFFGWLVLMLEPWTYGIDATAAIIIAMAVAYVFMTCFSGWEWITKAIAPWLNERRMAKA